MPKGQNHMQPPSNAVNQKMVAERCGVSQMTVSRVMRGKGSVSPEVVARVMEVARDLGYDPMAQDAARRLVMQRRGRRVPNHVVALIFPEVMLDTAYFNAIFKGVSSRLVHAGYSVLVVSLPYAPEEITPDTMPPIFRRGDIDGIITLYMDPRAVKVSECIKHLPVQTPPMLYMLWGPENAVTVRTDDRQGAYQIAQHLLEQGHRDLLLFIHEGETESPNDFTRRRVDGIRQALFEANIDPMRNLHFLPVPFKWMDPVYIQQSDEALPPVIQQRINEQKSALLKFVHEHPEVTAFMGQNDAVAINMTFFLTQQGYCVPEDYSVAGFDDTDPLLDEHGKNILTSVRLPLFDVGSEAARLLLEIMDGQQIAASRIELPVQFCPRQTTGAARMPASV